MALSSSEAGPLLEVVTLSPTGTLELTVWEIGADGTPGAATTQCWDFARRRARQPSARP
jgi:hypothetical protein